jgi:hypothetical protein
LKGFGALKAFYQGVRERQRVTSLLGGVFMDGILTRWAT